MKICLLIDNIGNGGAQRQLYNLALFLKKEKFDVEVLYYNQSSTFYKKKFKQNDIKLSFIRSSNSVFRHFIIVNYLTRKKYNLVVSFLIVPSLYNVLAKFFSFKGHKATCSFRSSHSVIETSFIKHIYIYIIGFYTDSFIVNSRLNYYYFKQYFFHKKVELVYNQVDSLFFQVFNPVNQNKIKVLVTSSHRNLKNGLGLAKAINMLSKEDKNHICVDWYGSKTDDSSYEDLSNYIKSNNLTNIITLKKPTTDVHLLLKKYDCIGLFSFHEGFPNTICEGASSGKLIISSKLSGLQEIFSHQSNLFFNPNNVSDIKDSFKQLISLDANQARLIQLKNQSIAKELFFNNQTLNNFIK